MKNYDLKPIMTEKAHSLMSKGVYTFTVGRIITKSDVKKAVKDLFSVDAFSVNIMSLKPKEKRIGKTRKFTSVGGHGKKAVVTLKSGQKIEALSPKTETKSKKQKKGSGEKDIQKVNIEGKEGSHAA